MEFTVRFLEVFFRDVIYASPLLGFFVAVVAGIGVMIGKQEGWSVADALYHAFINATTVGYEDFRPSRPGSKFLAVLLAFVGLLFGGIVVAMAAHAAIYAYTEIYEAAGFRGRLAN